MTQSPFVSIQRWAYVAGATPSEALINLARYLEETDFYLEEEQTVVVLSRDPDEEQYRAGLCVSWRAEEKLP